ncbi:chorismate-binding protein [Metallumcola ferriviriculae]|uniref:Anthranilate synthase component 1 n=1 Tax=Metallumcola ferriviriculae TaxID=3039180 RepID=A0AAU0UJJ4_9FIRM|nr:chorismate-binding protein [Desulfitibacteraceae bacterium MK1]
MKDLEGVSNFYPCAGSTYPLEFDCAPKCFPDIEEYVRQAGRQQVVPVYTEISQDELTPVTVLMKLGQSDHSFILESVEGNEQIARYSFISNDPYLIFSASGGNVSIGTAEARDSFPNRDFSWKKKENAEPRQELQQLLNSYTAEPSPDLPRFFGGAVGYFGFNAVGHFEEALAGLSGQTEFADVHMVFTRSVLVFDHLKGTVKIVINTLPGAVPQQTYRRARELIKKVLLRLKKSVNLPAVETQKHAEPIEYKSNFTREEFYRVVAQAKEYINNGDVFQVVLSQKFTLAADFDPLVLFRCLRVVNPSPYMFYLNCGGTALTGASPEMLVRLEGGEGSVRPIAGTRRRGKDGDEDRSLSKQLVEDEKEQAEHLMLVDLGRNDLGRVCTFGSVVVKEFAKVEYFSHVMHLVSRVKGKVMPGVKPLDVLAAAFPAGTVSGAPKIKAVEIINRLEKGCRGPYAGLVGYISFTGQMDTCINIRSVTLSGGKALVQSGAGIVADSRPDSEFQETLNKARGMFEAISMARGVKAR